jgi:hypothetical protein
MPIFIATHYSKMFQTVEGLSNQWTRIRCTENSSFSITSLNTGRTQELFSPFQPEVSPVNITICGWSCIQERLLSQPLQLR